MANRLAKETSPYLLQHKDNPVDWHPWGDEALETARREDKPILLSIGYSACHWCHVMEHESFEDPEIARLMNESFVPIKVDREERPDLDSIYMQVTTAMTGHGGWPMTVFLTPDGVPYYAGTYFPPTDRYNVPGFPRVLEHCARAYRERGEDVAKTAKSVQDFLERASRGGGERGELRPEQLEEAFHGLETSFDPVNGGFGGAPKFPPAMSLELLLRWHKRGGEPRALEMVERTLRRMAEGGMYDQLGGGFHRYSVDAHWLVPHFEKMLYDNALLARVYLAAYQTTGDAFYRRIAEETLDYLLREMTAPDGGFYSTQDADSEGEEGKFFVWTLAELRDALGPDADAAARYYDVTERGNWEHGRSILHVVSDPPENLDAIRRRLFEVRERRVHPGRDDKVLTSWNGLALRAFAEASSILDEPRYRDAAAKNAEFVLSTLRVDGRLRHSYKDGRARFNAYLEDYADYADGLLSLYEATFDERWFVEARQLLDQMVELYADEEGGGFFDTSSDHERRISRPKDLYDNATPSANSVACEVLLRLSLLTGERAYEDRAIASLERIGAIAGQAPSAFGRWLCAIDLALSEALEVALVGDPAASDARELLRSVWQPYLPNKVVALARPGAGSEVPLLRERAQRDGRATAYVCRRFACQAPTTDPAELARQLQ